MSVCAIVPTHRAEGLHAELGTHLYTNGKHQPLMGHLGYTSQARVSSKGGMYRRMPPGFALISTLSKAKSLSSSSSSEMNGAPSACSYRCWRFSLPNTWSRCLER
jgi:hypothetical protein